jgi:hypothetical protein
MTVADGNSFSGDPVGSAASAAPAPAPVAAPAPAPLPAPAALQSGLSGANNVDRIRDILFGNQMRDYELRFARLEESLLKESSDLRESTRQRLDTLENFIKRELDALNARLKSERDERSGSFRQLTKTVETLDETLTRKLGELDDQTSSAQAALRQDLLQQSKNIMDEIRAKHDLVVSMLERRYLELRHEKTDRRALSAFLSEVAMRLNDEFKIPSAE